MCVCVCVCVCVCARCVNEGLHYGLLLRFDTTHTLQVLVSIIFLFISFLAPAIAFGGLIEELTNNLLGETETLVATGFSGIIYGLFAVQPLAILAFTGPLLLFEKIVFEVSWLRPYM